MAKACPAFEADWHQNSYKKGRSGELRPKNHNPETGIML